MGGGRDGVAKTKVIKGLPLVVNRGSVAGKLPRVPTPLVNVHVFDGDRRENSGAVL